MQIDYLNKSDYLVIKLNWRYFQDESGLNAREEIAKRFNKTVYFFSSCSQTCVGPDLKTAKWILNNNLDFNWQTTFI
ncbi:hypothetical protein M3664_04585 [Paenibacillus lautus]|uniref:hypothetical protein n=1 Tax=Paenibacillus lautus TaxID=1401 RepID=UPI00203F9A9C|nr:hypothetical protein [Paenibacillus lautus]MCM3257058.1 hypothetical protein [Paenibacillus lautus]